MVIKSVKITSLLLAILILMTSLASCTEGGKELLMGFVQEWINTKFDIDTTDTSLIGRAEAAVRIANLLTQRSTGNPDADAALGTVKMAMNYAQAESLMDQGRKKDDPALMDQAIQLRPDDWSYRVSRATLALKDDQLGIQDANLERAGELVRKENNKASALRYYTQQINEVEAYKNSGELDRDRLEAQAAAYAQLYWSYYYRSQITNSPKDKQMADYYQSQETTISNKIKARPEP